MANKILSNSSDTLLTEDQVFTGNDFQVAAGLAIDVRVEADVDSVENGLVIQYSVDGESWEDLKTRSVIGGTPTEMTVRPDKGSIRVIYTNGPGAQSDFSLITLLKKGIEDVDISEDQVDKVTGAPIAIEYEHHEIHEGQHFNYCDYALNQASSVTIEFVITTPDVKKWSHFVFEVSASDGASIEIYEGASGISGGDEITPKNNDRNSDNESNLSIIKDPDTISEDGTKISGSLAGGGKTAGITSREKENILKQDTVYLVRITSLTVSNDIGWCYEWYEHTHK